MDEDFDFVDGSDVGDDYLERISLEAIERDGDAYMQAAYPGDFECQCIYPDADYCSIHGMYTPRNLREHPEWNQGK